MSPVFKIIQLSKVNKNFKANTLFDTVTMDPLNTENMARGATYITTLHVHTSRYAKTKTAMFHL